MVKVADQSIDRVRRYGLQIAQPADGYRFSLDALLLADFVHQVADNARIADLGTGCGVIPLVLCKRFQTARVVGIDNNGAMAGLARENALRNGFAGRIEILSEDILSMRERYPVSSFDGVVANPPFRTSASGRLSPRAGRDTARHESSAGMADFLACAKYLVKPAGRICFVHHPDRLAEFIRCAGELKLVLLRMRMVHGSVTAPAKIFLAELAKGRRQGACMVMPPLIVYGDDGAYTPELRLIMGEG
jgi:tRNA1Val (adenine37-N6)-methyltransferase